MAEDERRANREWNEKFSSALDCCKRRGCKYRGLISCKGCVEYYKGICLKGLEPNVHLIELLANPDRNQIY